MGVRLMDHVGIVVCDLTEAVAFFTELGLEQRGMTHIEGEWVDRVIGLEGASSEVAMMQIPGGGQLELVAFASPPGPAAEELPSNVPGLRHLTFLVDDLDDTLDRLVGRGATLVGTVENYRDVYRLCYLRGPAGVIVELAEEVR